MATLMCIVYTHTLMHTYIYTWMSEFTLTHLSKLIRTSDTHALTHMCALTLHDLTLARTHPLPHACTRSYLVHSLTKPPTRSLTH